MTTTSAGCIKRIIDRVTITGADDRTDPQELARLTEQFPFVEWGILLAKTRDGKPRFPTSPWLKELFAFSSLRLSGHICGSWVREIAEGRWTIFDERPELTKRFQRLQLNFHNLVGKIDGQQFLQGLRHPALQEKQIIFQLQDMHCDLLRVARENGYNAVPLFDTSGGKGLLPANWPQAVADCYCGYSGGLSPQNLAAQMMLIQECVNGPIWIDVERRVRTEDDSELYIPKVEQFLEAARPWVLS